MRFILSTAVVALILCGAAEAKKPPKGSQIARTIVATWTCQDHLGVPHTHARSPWKPHSAGYRRAELNRWRERWRTCSHALHVRADALRTGRYYRLPDADLYALADQAVKHGGIYSMRWGDASPILKGLCYEAVRRAFARYGTDQWALHIVNRESGCNPGAVNTTYSNPRERATCIAQMIPSVHTWIDYVRCKIDLRYAVRVFLALSNRGRSTGPWS